MVRKLQFVKTTGAGNDFVLIDNRDAHISLRWNLLAPAICNRRFGVGADGLLVLEKSTRADFSMKYFNADGSFGGMCGNGGRCAAAHVMADSGAKEVSFDALGHVYHARLEQALVHLEMKRVTSLRTNLKVKFMDNLVTAHYVDTGAPHAVVFAESLPETLLTTVRHEGIKEIGSAIRYSKRFAPAGTNVDFVTIVNPGTISMRTYERGVEDETLACGTGAVASAIAASAVAGMIPPISVLTRSNEVLTIYFRRRREAYTSIELAGPAQKVFEGSYDYDPRLFEH